MGLQKWDLWVKWIQQKANKVTKQYVCWQYLEINPSAIANLIKKINKN
jgi:hypothetical protein